MVVKPSLFCLDEIEKVSHPESSPEFTAVSKKPSAISRFGDYLKLYYNTQSIHCDDKLSIAPCSQFINLVVVNDQSKNHGGSNSSSHEEVVVSEEPVAIDALVMSDPRVLLVIGPAGIGKSTLCWELCRKWDVWTSLKRYKIVLQLKLRERRVQNATTLKELFYHEDQKLREAVVDEVLACEGEGVLLILDGFDELPTLLAEDENSLIGTLISGRCLPKGQVLLTSRPSVLHYQKYLASGYRHIEIRGFSEECIVQYVKSTLKSELCEVVLSNPAVKSLMYTPINCAIITQVYQEIERSKRLIPKTMTQLYTTLVLVLIRRHMIGERAWKEDTRIPKNLESLPEDLLVILKRVSELAYHRNKSDQLVFTDEDVGENFQHCGILIEVKEMYVCEGAKSSYSFPHKSIQEFLSAWHLSCNPGLLHDNFFTRLRQMTAFKKFVVGLFGCSKLPFDEMACYNVKVMVECLYEAQDSCKSLL